jgi:hypothetical protein
MARKMLIVQLKLKFNQLSKYHEEKIMNLSMDNIDEIITKVLILKDIKELENYFDK